MAKDKKNGEVKDEVKGAKDAKALSAQEKADAAQASADKAQEAADEAHAEAAKYPEPTAKQVADKTHAPDGEPLVDGYRGVHSGKVWDQGKVNDYYKKLRNAAKADS